MVESRRLAGSYARYPLLTTRYYCSDLEVLLHDFVGEGGDGAGGDDGAAVHGVEAVGNLPAEIDVLLDEEDRELALGVE